MIHTAKTKTTFDQSKRAQDRRKIIPNNIDINAILMLFKNEMQNIRFISKGSSLIFIVNIVFTIQFSIH